MYVPISITNYLKKFSVKGQDDNQKLQNDLDILQEWEREWDLEFNPFKCPVVHQSSH